MPRLYAPHSLPLILRNPSNVVRDSDCWDCRRRPVVIRRSKRLGTSLNESVSFLVRIPTYPSSGIAQKSIRSISAGARWPMQSPSTTNHNVPHRSRGSPPLLQLLHRRVRLPSVFDQNYGVARHLGHERGIKPSTATSLVVIVAINQPCLTIVQSRAFR